MSDTIRCEDCGAAATASEGGAGPDRFCRFCGAAFRVPEPTVNVVAQETRAESRQRRFAELHDHPATKLALSAVPSPATAMFKHGAGLLMLLVFLMIVTSIGGFQCSVANEIQPAFQDSGPTGFFSLFKFIPVLIIGLIVYQVVKAGSRTASVVTSPTVSWPARVVDESTEARRSGKNTTMVTIVTLENEDGDRQSFEISDRLAREMAQDDMGVAHSRGGELLDFQRVDV